MTVRRFHPFYASCLLMRCSVDLRGSMYACFDAIYARWDASIPISQVYHYSRYTVLPTQCSSIAKVRSSESRAVHCGCLCSNNYPINDSTSPGFVVLPTNTSAYRLPPLNQIWITHCFFISADLSDLLPTPAPLVTCPGSLAPTVLAPANSDVTSALLSCRSDLSHLALPTPSTL